MRHRVFVYGTLLRGEVNHYLLDGAAYLGPHRTEPCFSLHNLGAYPGLAHGGHTAVSGEVYELGDAGLSRLDRLEDHPRLYDRVTIPTYYGRAWIYLYRGSLRDKPLISSGDWRRLSHDRGSVQAKALRTRRDPKTRIAWSRRGAVAD
jgi:gamma-glutamylcyclotransferase (GGCT)/AIG2-like uncharacterized protein YtfP